MKYVYELTRRNSDSNFGLFSSRKKAVETAERMIEEGGQKVLTKNKTKWVTHVVSDEGVFYTITTIFLAD